MGDESLRLKLTVHHNLSSTLTNRVEFGILLKIDLTPGSHLRTPNYWLKSYQSRFLVSFKSCSTADFTLIVIL